jgi:GNAT superfamily N-acetyltransferase
MKIRPASATDCPAITKLINTAYEVERFFIPNDRINLESVQSYLDSGCYLLAEDASGLCGLIYFEIRGIRGYFGMLSVRPDMQGRGLARMLIHEVEKYLYNAQCRHLDIQIVNIRKELFPFYSKLGFVETGTEPFVKSDIALIPCHFINMSKPLDASVLASC